MISSRAAPTIREVAELAIRYRFSRSMAQIASGVVSMT
jgi:hypothetical protein